MATKKTLDELFDEDDSGLLDVKAKSRGVGTDESRVRQAFEEINVFVDRLGFAPGQGPKDRRIGISERALQTRLRTYLDSPVLAQALSDLDRHGLLKVAVVHQLASLDELLESGDDLLDDPNEDIFTMKIARAAPAKPELVSERAPCLDFEKFRPSLLKATNAVVVERVERLVVEDVFHTVC